MVSLLLCGHGNAGDTCASATLLPVGLPVTVIDDTGNFTNQHDLVTAPGCNLSLGGDGPEVVYRFTPVVSYGDVTVSLCSSAHPDTSLYIRTDCDDAFTQVACNEDGCGDGGDWRSVISGLTMLSGEEYFIFVDGFETTTGLFQLEITGTILAATPTPVPGDTCAAPIPITGPLPTTLDMDTSQLGGTYDMMNDTPCLFGAGGNGPEGVVQFVADRNYCAVDFSLCETANLATRHGDPGLYLRTACDVPSSQIACSEDVCGLYPRISGVPIRAGEERFLFVDGYGVESGPVRLTVQGLADNGIAADDCCNPGTVQLTGASLPWTWSASTVALNDDFADSGSAAPDAVLEIYPRVDLCSVSITVTTTGWTPTIDLWEATCIEPVSLGGTLGGSTGTATLEIPVLTQGVPVFVIIDGASPGDFGAFDMTVTGVETYPEGTCADPEVVTVAAGTSYDSGLRALRCTAGVNNTGCGSGSLASYRAIRPTEQVEATFTLHPTSPFLGMTLLATCGQTTSPLCVTSGSVPPTEPLSFSAVLDGNRTYLLAVTGLATEDLYRLEVQAEAATPAPVPAMSGLALVLLGGMLGWALLGMRPEPSP